MKGHQTLLAAALVCAWSVNIGEARGRGGRGGGEGPAPAAESRDSRPAPRPDVLGEAPPPESQDAVVPAQQLMITGLRVVEDPVRTDPRRGSEAVWTFGYLMEQMAGFGDASDFTLRWLEQWEQDYTVNGSTAPARPDIRSLVIEPWLRASGGQRLDLRRAPFKLLAIVNRMDLRVTGENGEVLTGGEGRFVFGVLGPDGKPLPPTGGDAPGGFLVIFEYELVATHMNALRDWTEAWAQLGRHRLGSREYNRALEDVTRRFTDRFRAPNKPNGSALNQIRSNEIALGAVWELREFVIDEATGRLTPHTVALTPDTVQLNGTQAFADLINTFGDALSTRSLQLDPASFAASSLSGPFTADDFPDIASRSFVTNVLGGPFFDAPWSAAGIVDNELRHDFAVQTCNGCHRDETGTGFVQVGFPVDHNLPRSLATPARLAAFLTGTTAPDPVDPTVERTFNDLERRRIDFEALIASFGPQHGHRGPRTRHVPRFVH